MLQRVCDERLRLSRVRRPSWRRRVPRDSGPCWSAASCFTGQLQARLGLDFTLANELELSADG